MPKMKTRKGVTKRGYKESRKKQTIKKPYIAKNMRETKTDDSRTENVAVPGIGGVA